MFVGACFSETEKTWFYEKLQVNGFGLTGCARAMLANRISYWLGVNGELLKKINKINFNPWTIHILNMNCKYYIQMFNLSYFLCTQVLVIQ